MGVEDNLDRRAYTSPASPDPTAGTPGGYEEFVRRHYAALVRAAHAATGDHGLAEDVVQETLLRALRRWPAAQDGGLAYVHAILRNVLVDRHRRAERRPKEAPWAQHEASAAGTDDPTDELDAALDLLATLPTQQRLVLALRFLDDLSVEQTAAAMGCSTGTVKSHTSRALSSLRRRLAGHRATAPSDEVAEEVRP